MQAWPNIGFFDSSGEEGFLKKKYLLYKYNTIQYNTIPFILAQFDIYNATAKDLGRLWIWYQQFGSKLKKTSGKLYI